MRVLITGSTGFTGRHMAALAVSQGSEVHGVSLDAEPLPAVAGHVADLTRPGAAAEVVRSVRPDRVFHLAALVPRAEARFDLDELIVVNVLGTQRLLEAVAENAAGAKTVVVGSAAMYGAVSPECQPIDEAVPYNPTTAYGTSKAMQDVLAGWWAAGQGLSVVRARTFNQIGPGGGAGLVGGTLARQVARIEAGKQDAEISVRYLSTQRDFTDVRDVVRAYWLMAERGVPGAVYNVCSGQAESIGSLLERLLELASLSGVSVVEREAGLLPGDAALSVGDPGRLKAHTGWEPIIPLKQSLADLLDEWRELVKSEAP
ncbi:MAG: NAD-dependent epimerase/dehydratase family protein [Anaerolineales bacterium]|nr:MAG: NAD-dependent epimerase/dehydratase family protein [Anaerolineales bacterium]